MYRLSYSVDDLLRLRLCRWSQATDQLHSSQDQLREEGRQSGARGSALGQDAQLATSVARVRVAARRVAPTHEVVVHERRNQAAVTAGMEMAMIT